MTTRIFLLLILLIGQAGCTTMAPGRPQSSPEARLRHVISPGFINLHDHLGYDQNPPVSARLPSMTAISMASSALPSSGAW